MEFVCALFFLMIMVAASALLPIFFGIAIIYIAWRILKKKEWV
jgi:hypothetical protein